MNKHALMLSAAAVALMASPALAADNSHITTKVTTQLKTSTANNGAPSDILIDTGGSVVVTTAGPAIEIDSNNSVNNSVVGALISNLGTDKAIGIQLDATAAGTGPGAGVNVFTNTGTVDLTGTGTGKTGILVAISPSTATSGTFNGGIDLASGSTLKVTGDSSNGIHIVTGATLVGDVKLGGALAVNASSATATTASNIAAFRLDGTLNGDLNIASTGNVGAIGAGAQGIVLTGLLDGSFINNGILQAAGTAAPVSTAGNPEASSALIVNSSITGGIFNAGPASSSDTATAPATIVTRGPASAVFITPLSTATSALEIGPTSFTPTGFANPFGFVNRGTISGLPIDANVNSQAINLTGAGSASPVTIDGGIFNSGVISASSGSNLKAQPGANFTATGLFVGDFVTVPALVNSNVSGKGSITASLNGSTVGSAVAIEIFQNDTKNPTSSLQKIDNSGSIVASARTTDTTISSLSAFAIEDKSGRLTTIINSGTISADATTLDNNKQQHVAADLSLAQNNIMFSNSGTVTGDIRLGAHNDTVTVTGTSSKAASITGDIAFNGGADILQINDFANVTGQLTERGGGTVDVTVGTGTGTGTLTLNNTTQGLTVSNLAVKNGGTLNLSLSQAFNSTSANFAGSIVDATGNIDLDTNSKFGLAFGSFISAPGGKTAQFELLEAPNGNLTIGNFSAIKREVVGDPANNVKGKIPFLFTGTLCGYNTAGTDPCTAPAGTTAPSDSQLVVQLAPKTVSEIGLTGNAAKIFDQANAALANDDQLGSRIVTDVVDQPTAQKAYSSFLPDVTGSSRAVVISITDQATGPVGARQRALRMYAAQPGGATLWGQEFVERLNSNRSNTDAFRATGFGFALGADDGDPRNGRYGAALTFFSGDQNNKGPNFTKTTNEWYLLSGYTDWRGKGFFLDSQLSAGYGKLNGKRFLHLTDPNDSNIVFTRTARSKRVALLAAGGVSTGIILTYGSTVITPQLSVDGLTLREEGYTESGGGSIAGGDGFDLRVQPYYASSVRGYFGTSLREDLNLGDFYIQPEVRAGYRYDFLPDPVKLKAAFVSLVKDPNSQFTLTGPGQRQGNVVGGASIAITTGAWSLGVNYDYLRGQNGSVSQAGTVTLVGRI